MWCETYHRFNDRAAFLAACDAAGWGRDPLSPTLPAPPPEVGFSEIGALVARPTLAPDGAPIPGAVIDAGFHVNMAWHGGTVQEGFVASRVHPATPSRTFGLAPPPSPPPPVVPSTVAAWQGKAWLLQQGQLPAAEAAAQAAGGVALLAFQHAAEWHRDSALISVLAAALGLDAAATDAAFIAASKITG